MRIARHKNTLLSSAGPLAVDTNGTTYRVETQPGTEVDEAELDVRFYVGWTQADGATSPTSQVVIQHSPDGVTWVTLVSGTQLTANGSQAQVLDSTSISLMPYIRAILDVGGGTAPNVTNIAAYMLSNSPLILR